jgi:hypothetical protein
MHFYFNILHFKSFFNNLYVIQIINIIFNNLIYVFLIVIIHIYEQTVMCILDPIKTVGAVESHQYYIGHSRPKSQPCICPVVQGKHERTLDKL